MSVASTQLLTVHRALRVLDFVAMSDTPPVVKVIAAGLGLNLSSTYHIVNTLVSDGYLEKRLDGSTVVGPRIAVLNAAFLRTNGLLDAARPLVEELALFTGETVYLTRLMGTSAVVSMVIESPHSLRVSGLQVGYSGNENRRASGRAILSQLQTEDLRGQRAVETMTANEIGRLDRDLERVRLSGYALDDEEFEAGVCCVAAPYFDSGGQVAGSVALSAPSVRASTMTTTYRDHVINTANRLTKALRPRDSRLSEMPYGMPEARR